MTAAEAAEIMMSGGEGDGKVKAMNITKNGTYSLTSDDEADGYIGYSPLHVNVPKRPIVSKTFTENDVYKVDDGDETAWNPVIVDVPNTPHMKGLTVVEPGKYWADGFDCDGFDPVNGSDKYKKMYEYVKRNDHKLVDTGIGYPLITSPTDSRTTDVGRVIKDTTIMSDFDDAIEGLKTECQTCDGWISARYSDGTRMSPFKKNARNTVYVVSGERVYCYGISVTYASSGFVNVGVFANSVGKYIRNDNDGATVSVFSRIAVDSNVQIKSCVISGYTATFTLMYSRILPGYYLTDDPPQYEEKTVTITADNYPFSTSGTVCWGGQLTTSDQS